RLRQRVGEPHHAARSRAVPEPEGVAELVDGLGGGASTEPVGAFRGKAQARDRKHRHAPALVGFAEHEVQVGRVKVHVCDAQQAEPVRALGICEHVQNDGRPPLVSLLREGVRRQGNSVSNHDVPAENRASIFRSPSDERPLDPPHGGNYDGTRVRREGHGAGARQQRMGAVATAASVPLEELHGALVALRGRKRIEGAEVPPLARARVLLARVEAELARVELSDHAAKLLIGAAARHPAYPPRKLLLGRSVGGSCYDDRMGGACTVIFPLPVGSETGHQWGRKARGEISMNSIRGWNATAWCIAWFLGACGGGGKPADTAAAASGASRAARTAAQIANPGLDGPAMTVKLSVLSSPPQFVSGSDARIHVTAAPGLRDKLELRLDGRHLDATLQEVSDGLEGVIRGLKVGDNLLEVKHRNANVRDAITLTNYPITGPMFTGPHQTPFVCTTIQSAVGRQPLVDSATPPGYRVTDAQGHTIGYSRDCSIDTFFSYFYRSTSGALKVMPGDGSRPPDLGTVTLPDGRAVDFVVRREIGSINRFLYSIAMLAPLGEDPANPDLSLWNRKLLYWFQGGVA